MYYCTAYSRPIQYLLSCCGCTVHYNIMPCTGWLGTVGVASLWFDCYSVKSDCRVRVCMGKQKDVFDLKFIFLKSQLNSSCYHALMQQYSLTSVLKILYHSSCSFLTGVGIKLFCETKCCIHWFKLQTDHSDQLFQPTEYSFLVYLLLACSRIV